MKARSSTNISNVLYLAVTAFWIVQLVISLSSSTALATGRYHISALTLHLISFVFSLPTLLIWLALAYAINCFVRYLGSIGDSPETGAFGSITVALGVMLAASVTTGLLQTYESQLTSAGGDLAMRNSLVVGINYITVLAALVYYGLLFRGSSKLLELSKQLKLVSRNVWMALLPMAVVGAGYIALILSNPNRQFSTSPDMPPAFALSDPMIIATVAVPYIIAWLIGISALMNLTGFYKSAKGVVYRMLFHRLFIGLSLVIGLTIGLQFLAQFSDFWQQTGLGVILLLVTVILLVLIYAFFEVARGARELVKIEQATIGPDKS